MARRMAVVGLAILLCGFWMPQPTSSQEPPSFRLGFGLLASLIPDVVGEPLEEEHHNAINGDGLQQTTTGLMVWRKADNWTAFTDGWLTWVNGPLGLQERRNDERFGWELGATDKWELLPAPESVPAPAREDETLDGGQPSPSVAPPSMSSPTATPLPELPVATAVPGGVVSSMPAGLWCTSLSVAARYYVSRENENYWGGWSPENRIWFPDEATLLAAFPGRSRIDPTPTATPRPSSSVTATAAPPPPTVTPAPTSTPARTRIPSPTATGLGGGIRSEIPAGDWVTSVASDFQSYCTSRNPRWMSWHTADLIWFQTEEDLLLAYPGRVLR